MEDKGKGLVVGEDEENSLSVSEGGPSPTDMDVDGSSDDNYDDDQNDQNNSDDDDDEGDDDDEVVSGIPTTLEYHALAEKKRKALQRDGSEKRGKCDAINTSNGCSELFSTGGRRRRRKNKKRGRRQGSNKQVSPEIRKRLSEALFLHADNKDSEAFSILFDIIKEAPVFGQAYYHLALVPDSLGKTRSWSSEALKAAAYIEGSKSHVWKLLYDRAKEQGDMSLARKYASKAVQADPENIPLKQEYASLCLSAGTYKEAAETYEKIFRRHPETIELLKLGAEYFLKSGEGERAANMLEDHIKSHPSEVGPDILDQLADVLMQINTYDRALKYIHDVRHQIYNLGKELPSSLKIRQAICHVRLQEMELAENVLRILPLEAVSEHPKLTIDLADELTNIENFHSALKYYLLAINDTLNNGYLFVKVAGCYMSLENREQAIVYYYRALNELSDPVDTRITLASLLLEDGKRDEAISVLSPPENPDLDTSKQKAWWKKRKIRMHLCQMYHSEGMLEEFAKTALELVLKWVWRRMVKGKKKTIGSFGASKR